MELSLLTQAAAPFFSVICPLRGKTFWIILLTCCVLHTGRALILFGKVQFLSTLLPPAAPLPETEREVGGTISMRAWEWRANSPASSEGAAARGRGRKEEGTNDFLLTMVHVCGLLLVFAFKCWVFLFHFSERWLFLRRRQIPVLSEAIRDERVAPCGVWHRVWSHLFYQTCSAWAQWYGATNEGLVFIYDHN